MTYTTEKIGRLVRETSAFSPVARQAAGKCVVDAVSSALCASDSAGLRAISGAACRIWADGPASVWFSGCSLEPVGAAFVNASAVSMLDFDDGHRMAAGHPGAAVVPAVLAEVDRDPTLADKALDAIVIGYEVGVRISAARDLSKLETLTSGRWTGQAVAAAIGWLRGSPPETIAGAIAITSAVAPLMTVSDFTQVGNHVKEAIHFSCMNAFVSLELATSGMLAPLDVLDDQSQFDGARLLDGFGSGSWLIESVYFKPYSCCRWIHAAIDAALALKKIDGDAFAGSGRIRVDTFARTLTLNNQIAPLSLEAAQFSTPFCLGVAVVHGTAALAPLERQELLKDPEVLKVAARVDMNLAPELDAMFSGRVPSRVTVDVDGQLLSETVLAPLGEPSNPMDWERLVAKFESFAEKRCGSERARRFLTAFQALRNNDIRPLMAELSRQELATPAKQAGGPALQILTENLA
ncbi:MmgE/PrpD family protein [Rhizobium leguminosarum]|uniref:MmgE/PrpD family protein n=1 Tax=Rhizobium leguminosarum TaxID=384 RepID=UPI0014427F29|nr:MmgE/PrpD family protein [Rhizobium leguminosarum]